MEIPLFINGQLYENHTIEAWQSVWDKICKMSYDGTDVCEEIVTTPGIMHINGRILNNKYKSDHIIEYSRLEPVNTYFLTLENVWKQYSSFHGPQPVKVIPEFKKLVVPRCLYECLGVQQWFRYSFPNCQVTYWDE
jgi:hypothetical protein